MYRLTPRLLLRPNMNFYLAWKKRSLQKQVSAVYYFCVKKTQTSFKPHRKVLQKLLLNDPMQACSLCYAALCPGHSVSTRPKKPTGLATESHNSSLSYNPTFLFGSPDHLDVTAGTCAGDMVQGVPSLLCSRVVSARFCNCTF